MIYALCLGSAFGGQPRLAGTGQSSFLQAASLMRSLGIAAEKTIIEHDLHFFDRVEPSPAFVHSEVLAEQRAMETLDAAVRPRSIGPDRAVFNLFELEEQLLKMTARPAAGCVAITHQELASRRP